MTPIIRIVLRYVAAALVAKGWLLPEDANALASDPELVAGLEVAAGALIGLGTEYWYWLARKLGGDT